MHPRMCRMDTPTGWAVRNELATLQQKFLGCFNELYIARSSLSTSHHSTTSCDVPLWSGVLL